MELFTIDDEGIHAGVEVMLGTEWLCSVGLTEALRMRLHTAACARCEQDLAWRTDTRVMLGSAAFEAGYTGKRLDVTSQEREVKERDKALVFVDVHGGMSSSRVGRVLVKASSRVELVSMVKQITRTRMLLLTRVGETIEVLREGDTTNEGQEPPLPSYFRYKMYRPSRGEGLIIPRTIHPYPFQGVAESAVAANMAEAAE